MKTYIQVKLYKHQMIFKNIFTYTYTRIQATSINEIAHESVEEEGRVCGMV